VLFALVSDDATDDAVDELAAEPVDKFADEPLSCSSSRISRSGSPCINKSSHDNVRVAYHSGHFKRLYNFLNDAPEEMSIVLRKILERRRYSLFASVFSLRRPGPWEDGRGWFRDRFDELSSGRRTHHRLVAVVFSIRYQNVVAGRQASPSCWGRS
jgi:hypothetical protein